LRYLGFPQCRPCNAAGVISNNQTLFAPGGND
jgi:hypothetical protein